MSLSDVVRVGALCVLYIATARVGLSLDAVHGLATAVWPPTGLALAALVLYGYHLWPGIALGAFLVNLWAGVPVLVAGGMALGNTLEAVVGTVLLQRVVGFRPALDRLRDVLGLVVLAAGLSTLLSATIGVSSGWLGGVIPPATYGEAWRTWWLGDAVGDLVVAPLLFVWSRRGRVALSRRWIVEAMVLLVAVGTLSLVVFDVPALALPLPRYLIFAALILVAMRLGPQGAATALALRAALAIWGTAQGVGPFAGPTLHESFVFLQTFMSIVAVTILVLAAVIAERRQAHAAVHEQHERLHVTLLSISDAVIATESQGRVTFLNPVAERLTGWPAAEALGKDSTEVVRMINEDTRQGVEPPVATVIRAGTVVGLAHPTLLIARDGVERPIEASGAPMCAPQGRVLGVVLVLRDITARRRAEDARTRLAAIVESSEDAIIGMTLAGIMTSWNRGAERLYGATAADVIGRSIAILVPPDRPHELPELLTRLARGDAVEHYETLWRRHDGQVIPVSLTVSPIRDLAGTIVGASTIARDITARKQAEDAIRVAHARLQRVLEGGGLGTWLWDIPHGQVWEDAALIRLCGQTREERTPVRLQTVLSLVDPDDRAQVQAALDATMHAGRDYDVEYRIIRPDGMERWMASRGRVERDAQGRPWRVTGVCVDITERKRAEASLRQAQRLEALGTLAGGVAHDFNNILAAILVNTALTIDHLPPDHPVQRHLAAIDQASRRATDLVRHILTFSRPQHGTRHVIVLQPVVEEALQLLRATLPAMIEIHSSFATGVPAVVADATDIHQILINLGVNAAQAMGDHGGRLEVRLEPMRVDAHLARLSAALQVGLYAHVSVRDNGHGIDRATLAHIFEPFFTTKRAREGTGLGLAIVQEIMQQYDGAITVYSEPGKGTLFDLYFPAAAATAAAPVPLPTERVQGDGVRVLYVDDEAGLVFIVTQMLEQYGYTVTGCTTTAQALQAFRTHPHAFDVVVTDLAMPEMSGLEFARALLHIRPDVPILMFSGYLRPEDRATAQRLGLREPLLKPNGMKDLAEIVQRLFREEQGRQEGAYGGHPG